MKRGRSGKGIKALEKLQAANRAFDGSFDAFWETWKKMVGEQMRLIGKERLVIQSKLFKAVSHAKKRPTQKGR